MEREFTVSNNDRVVAPMDLPFYYADSFGVWYFELVPLKQRLMKQAMQDCLTYLSAPRSAHGGGRAPRPENYVFCSQTTDNMTKATLHNRNKAISEAAKEAGILRRNLHVSTHVLRHTCATRLLDAGIDIYTVSRHLGHSNVSTTDRYLRNQADLTEALKKMAGETAA